LSGINLHRHALSTRPARLVAIRITASAPIQREALERAIDASRRRSAQIRRLAFDYSDTSGIVIGAHQDEPGRRLAPAHAGPAFVARK
jgi:hypothetical protein